MLSVVFQVCVIYHGDCLFRLHPTYHIVSNHWRCQDLERDTVHISRYATLSYIYTYKFIQVNALWQLFYLTRNDITIIGDFVLACFLYRCFTLFTWVMVKMKNNSFFFSFFTIGMNSLVVYVCHDVFYRFFPVNWHMENPMHWHLLLKAVWDTAIWVVLAYILYRKRIFIAL